MDGRIGLRRLPGLRDTRGQLGLQNGLAIRWAWHPGVPLDPADRRIVLDDRPRQGFPHDTRVVAASTRAVADVREQRRV
jgi:hypothetical protein